MTITRRSNADPTGPVDPAATSETSARRRKWRLGERPLFWAAVLGILALVLASGAGGWWLADQTLVASANSHPTTATAAPVSLGDGLTMPDVRGLTRNDATQVLADAGIPASAVAFEDSPSAAPQGVVVTQTPVFGARNPAKVTLGVAIPATMPNLAGKSRADAVTTLSALGVTVSVAFAYSRDSTPGTVTGSNPAPGVPLGLDATITVAGASATIPLSSVKTLHDECSTGSSVTVGGTDYPSSILCQPNAGTEQAVWLTQGKADRLTGTLGMPDTVAPGSSAHVQILANGSPILDQQITYGQTIEVDLPTTGALQLAFVVASAGNTDVAFASATLYGDDAAIAGLKN